MKTIYALGKNRIKCSAVTVGKFDGVHCGHRFLLELLSKEEKLTKIVFTFKPLDGSPIKNDRKLCNDAEKIELLSAFSPDITIIYPFGRKQSQMSPKRFVKEILIRKLGMKKLFVGPDFCFGKHGRGDVAMLERMAEKYGFDLIVPDKIEFEGEAISSTRIRKEIEAGNLENAEKMLGHSLKA